MDYLERQRSATEQGRVKLGDYIVIQRQDQTKLHKVSLEYVSLGKDKIDFSIIIGKPVWKTYKMIPKRFTKREYYLIECPANSEYVTRELNKNVSSLCDDSKSHLKGMEENTENSRSFQNISGGGGIQRRFTKRKDKKFLDDRRYFEYVTVRWPTVRLISEILFRYDPGKIMGLRTDTLSQILSAAGVQSGGTYIVYENRCEGLVVAAVLNCLSEGGHLIHVHPSNFAQNFAVNAMNFKSEQMSRIIYSNVNNLLMKLENRLPLNEDGSDNNVERISSIGSESSEKGKDSKEEKSSSATTTESSKSTHESGGQDKRDDNSKKRKYTDDDEFAIKKAKWNLEADKATRILNPNKADGLILVAREHPGNILNALLPYVAQSRPFVVFCPCLDPLLEVYVQLKSKNSTICLRVTETFLRKQHVKSSNTHPDSSMSGGGGYLLSGIVVDNTEPVEPVPE